MTGYQAERNRRSKIDDNNSHIEYAIYINARSGEIIVFNMGIKPIDEGCPD
jgi:hypothetical protein